MLLAILFLSVATGTMVNVALPWITTWAGGEPGAAGWVVTGYLLSFAVFNVVHGRLADRVGLRRLYLLGVAGFGFAGLACMLAPNLPVLIAVRLLQGVGAGALPSLGVTIVGRLLPPDQRGPSMGLIMATVGVSATISPVLGGFLVEAASWRAVFLAPASALLLWPLAAWVLPRSLDEDLHAEPFDFLGAGLLGLGAALLLLGADALRHTPGSAAGPALLLAGPGVLAASWAWSKRQVHPFLPPALLANRAYRALLLTGAAANGLRFGSVVLVSLLLAACFDASGPTIGLSLVPGAVVLALFARRSGAIAGSRGARALGIPGMLGLVLSCFLAALLVPWGATGMAVSMALFGLAFAAVQPSLLTGVADALPRELQGVGNGLYLMVFFLGAALGVALVMTVIGVQDPNAAAITGLGPPGSGPYVNALLALGAAGLVTVPVLGALPARGRGAALRA